jgi:Putative zinc dependent peptidase (DUF5700)
MIFRTFCRACVPHLVGLFLVTAPALAEEVSRIRIQTDFSEADAALTILDKRNASQPVKDSDWQALFITEPYQRLKKREAAMHREFTDDDFKKFILSDELLKEHGAVKRTVLDWKQADIRAAAMRALQYLPAESVIQTKVFPLIKPLHNSFVFDVETDPAIFLYVDPSVSPAAFENTVAHEMHHIGLGSLDKLYEQKVASLPPAASRVAMWMGAFGEGEAMLAAAGGPDADPVATASPEIRDNWARGMRDFNADLEKVSDFFLQVLGGKLQGDAIRQRGSDFFGLQGPWYTVGYRMAVIVERRFGRAALIECLRDRRLLLVRYNAAAQEMNQSSATQQTGIEPGAHLLTLWPREILEGTQAPPG